MIAARSTVAERDTVDAGIEGGAVRRILGGFALVLTLTGSASAERLPIKTYTTADGLAHLRVTCIVVDSRGFLWLCGPQGLSRFDGQGFATYGVPEGLANTRINNFLQTSLGAYFVATNGGGVYRFTPLIDGRVTRRARTSGQRRRLDQRFPVHGIARRR